MQYRISNDRKPTKKMLFKIMYWQDGKSRKEKEEPLVFFV